MKNSFKSIPANWFSSVGTLLPFALTAVMLCFPWGTHLGNVNVWVGSIANADPWVWSCVSVHKDDDNHPEMEECSYIAHEHPHARWRPAAEIIYFPRGAIRPEAVDIPTIGIDYASAYPVTIETVRSKYGPDEEGDLCDYGDGSANGIVGKWGHKRYACLEDLDGDGIANIYDDCPFSADNSYCSDLPDCDEGIQWIVGAAGGVAAVASGLSMVSMAATAKSGVVATTVVIGGAVAPAVFVWAGVAAGLVVVGATTYCAVSYYEN